MMTREPSTRPNEQSRGDLQITAECCINKSSMPCDLLPNDDLPGSHKMSADVRQKRVRPNWNSRPASRPARIMCTTFSPPHISLSRHQEVTKCPRMSVKKGFDPIGTPGLPVGPQELCVRLFHLPISLLSSPGSHEMSANVRQKTRRARLEHPTSQSYRKPNLHDLTASL